MVEVVSAEAVVVEVVVDAVDILQIEIMVQRKQKMT
jgi:hypothetical protein